MNALTFGLDPEKRDVSHYNHSINWDSFYRKHAKDSLMEWEKRYSMGNYQVRFLAGEENLEKAIDILNQKIKWVGITEKFEESCCSFKNYLSEDDFHIELKRTNSSLSNRDEINEILLENQEFILENNQLDADLYRYILTDVWPAQAKRISIECDKSGKSRFEREINFLMFQYNRYQQFRPTELNTKNLKRFYRRWMR